MVALNLNELEAIARAATPGPWEYRHESPSMNGEKCTIRQAGVPGIRMSAHVYGFGTGMIEHIATFDPPTVLALIARLREAEAVIAQILDYEGPEAADMRDIALAYKPLDTKEGTN